MDLIEQLKRDEGLRLTAYRDSLGIWTIGYGHNLNAHPPFYANCTDQQAHTWLVLDSAEACAWLREHLPWTDRMDEVRRAALQNMAYQLGSKLLGFHRSLTLIEDHYFKEAATEMLASLWARET